jgi:hypothetical protein
MSLLGTVRPPQWLMSLRRSLTSVWPDQRERARVSRKSNEKEQGYREGLRVGAHTDSERRANDPSPSGCRDVDSILDSLKDALALVSRCGKKNCCEKNSILQVITTKSKSLWEEERYSSGHHNNEVHRQETG